VRGVVSLRRWLRRLRRVRRARVDHRMEDPDVCGVYAASYEPTDDRFFEDFPDCESRW
jgi:hypothetical protein